MSLYYLLVFFPKATGNYKDVYGTSTVLPIFSKLYCARHNIFTYQHVGQKDQDGYYAA